LLACGADPERKREDGRTPLHLAAASGSDLTVALLLSATGDVAPADSAGVTPLHLAAGGGHLAVVEHLLDSGADPRATDERGFDALCFAAAGGADPVIAELLERGLYFKALTSADEERPRFPPILLAVQCNHMSAATRLLAAGFSIETKNAAGWTPLMLAAYDGNLKMVRLLLKHGADIQAKDRSGWTALTAAVRRGSAKTACALLKAGADARPERGPDLLQLATRAGYTKIAECLEAHSADDSIDSKEPRR